MAPEETTGADAGAVASGETSEATASTEDGTAASEEEDEGPISLDSEPTSDEDVADTASKDKGEDGVGEGDDVDADADEAGDGEDEGEDGEDAPEMLSFDFGGNTLEVPKDSVPPELAEEIDRFAKGTWSSFTKGQQENVERSQTLDTQEKAVAKITSLNGEALQTYSYGLQLRSDIAQLQSVDLAPLWNSQDQADRDRARHISDVLASKQAEFTDIVNRVGEQEGALEEAQTAEIGRRAAEGEAQLNKRFKNFSTEKAPDVVKYVVDTYGMSRREADTWRGNPIMTEMAYKAMLYDRQIAARKGRQKRPAQAQPVPARKGTGKATQSTRDPDKMPMGTLRKHLGITAEA